MGHIAEGILEPNPLTNELNAYAKGKQVAEKLCLTAGTHDICAPKIARLFAFSGKFLPRDTHFAIGNFVQNVLDRQPILIKGDGRSLRSYLHGADMATWLWCTLTHLDIREPIHIGSEHAVSILQLANTVAKVSETVLNYRPKILISKSVDLSKPNDNYVPSTTRTRAKLRVSEWTELESCIISMLASST